MKVSISDRISGFSLIEAMIALATVGLLAVVAVPLLAQYAERARVVRAVVDIGDMSAVIKQWALDNRGLPETLDAVGLGARLDPWGHPYRYQELETQKGKGKSRKDKKLNPLNTDFDLYSIGRDGDTVLPLPPPVSHDDVVRARDGRFIGLGKDFDP